jgi:hypothetical protein
MRNKKFRLYTNIVILGKFSELIIGSWLGGSILVNTHSRAINAETVIQATLLVDVGFRYASAFCASSYMLPVFFRSVPSHAA